MSARVFALGRAGAESLSQRRPLGPPAAATRGTSYPESVVVMKLAVIPGDGIGPEVVAEALKVLDVVLPGVQRTGTRLAPAARAGLVAAAWTLRRLQRGDRLALPRD